MSAGGTRLPSFCRVLQSDGRGGEGKSVFALRAEELSGMQHCQGLSRGLRSLHRLQTAGACSPCSREEALDDEQEWSVALPKQPPVQPTSKVNLHISS